MGLLYEHSCGRMVPASQDHVLDMLHTLHSSVDPFLPTHPQFQLVSTPAAFTPLLTKKSDAGAGGGLAAGHAPPTSQWWRTDIAGAWPYPFSVCSLGPSRPGTQYAAALLTCIKLKVLLEPLSCSFFFFFSFFFRKIP